MSAEFKKEIQLEIAHVLFIDIVGYSKLSVNEQHARVDELSGIVRLSEQFQNAEAANRILHRAHVRGLKLRLHFLYWAQLLPAFLNYYLATPARP